MYRLKGFGAFPPISKNTRDQVNPLGELSAYAMTFATDRGIFKEVGRPNSLLYTFSSVNEVSLVEVETVDVPPAVAALILEIMETMYGRALAGDFEDDVVPVREYMLDIWGGQIQNVIVHSMVTDGNLWLPSSIMFEGTSTTSPYSAQVWFSDEAFRAQYDLYEIKVVAPIDNIDRFFDSLSTVAAIVDDEITIADTVGRVAVLAGDQPYTQMVTEEFEWIDPDNDDARIAVPWTCLIYGEAGRNIDAIRRALSTWIMANTSYSEEVWAQLFPDIFGATEFIFTPFWSHHAIPDDAVNSGIYSPVNNIQNALTMAKALIRGNGYTSSYITSKLNIMATVYKSLQVGVVGGYRNRDDVNQIGDRWMDMIAVSTSSIDFRRMSESTQRLLLTLNTLLQIAEAMTATSPVPRGYMRLIRDGVLYVTATYERTTLIVASRVSTLERFNPKTGIALDPA